MECPHVHPYVLRVPSNIPPFICSVCDSVESLLICLECGDVLCGRYIKGHAELHSKTKKHPLAVDCYSYGAFCYVCNDFIPNKHKIHSSIFDRLKAINDMEEQRQIGIGTYDDSSNSSLGNTTTDELLVLSSLDGLPTTPSRRGRKTYVRTTTSRTAAKEMKETADAPPTPPGAQTRTGRKRSAGGDYNSSSHDSPISDLSSRQEQRTLDPKKQRLTDVSPTSIDGIDTSMRPAKENVSMGLAGTKNGGKHGVVGLKNLGNTCFMNAVFQSLSKIRGFSCYISHIPPPDKLLNKSESLPLPTRRIYSTRSRKNCLLSTSQQNSINLGGTSFNGMKQLDSMHNEGILRTEELLTNELRKILILLNTKGSAAVSPDSLISIIWSVMPGFRGYQQDAHEFLRYMLDQLHSELIRLIPCFSWNGPNHRNGSKSNGNGGYFKPIGGKNLRSGQLSETLMSVFGFNSIVTSMFGGILENEVRCSRCGMESKKNDPFLDLSLDIPIGVEVRLEDCLSNFMDVEELSDSDKYFCSNCKTLQKSTKRFSIQRLPDVLCIHLKRFRWSKCLRSKLDHFIQFPMSSLDMSDYLLDKLHKRGSTSSHIYELAAVIVHHGSGVGSGHYTAFAKNDGQWYHFNDSAVTPSEESAVAKCKAYILFYTSKERL